jgi:GT2 family glycosyltransferase
MPDPLSYSVTFACYNQLDYTRKCVESLIAAGVPLHRIVPVDNGSTDGTRGYLEGLPFGRSILNSENFGCGVAWNQGVLEQQAEWSVVMNNDVVVPRRWIEPLLEAAQAAGLAVASPAMVNGPLDYDLEAFAARGEQPGLRDYWREGFAHGVCMAIHRSVWTRAGLFRATPRLMGFEDTLFFHEVAAAGMRLGTVGRAWIHHYGSVTQKAMKAERGLRPQQGLGARDSKKLLMQGWLRRKISKARSRSRLESLRAEELRRFGLSLIGWRTRAHGFEWQ